MKNLDVYMFAEIGKTKISSLASENLLIDLKNNLNFSDGNKVFKLYFYSIYEIYNFKKWLFNCFLRSSNNRTLKYLPSTSIKLIRDFLYISNIFFTYFIKKPNHIIIYNLNKIQLLILAKFRNLITAKISLIQADGVVINEDKLCIFNNVYVFSKNLYKLYNEYSKKTQIIHCFPLIQNNYVYKNRKKSLNNKKEILILHSGSISEYNLPKKNLEKLVKIVNSNRRVKIIFTTTQEKIPHFFQIYLKKFASSFFLKKDLSVDQLDDIISKCHFGLDIRDNKNINSNVDFPSKILLYIKNNVTVFSTLSNSIPNEIKEKLLDFKNIENYITDIDDEIINQDYKFINNLLNEKCLNAALKNSISN